MQARERKECHICNKNISATNFARHLGLHVFCHSCGIWTSKKKHRHSDIFAPTVLETSNFVQVWIPVLIPSRLIHAPQPTDKTEPILTEPEDVLSEFFFDTSPSETLARELSSILVDIPNLEAELISINLESALLYHPEFSHLDKDILKREVFAKLGRSVTIENGF